jgi:hypothetical protein
MVPSLTPEGMAAAETVNAHRIIGANDAERTRTPAEIAGAAAHQTADLSNLWRSDATNQHRAARSIPESRHAEL